MPRTARHIRVPGEDEERWRNQFHKATGGRNVMTLLQFMQVTACRSRYYAVRLFDKLDSGKSGSINFGEFATFMHLLANGDNDTLTEFAFTLIAKENADHITPDELREALIASIEESDSAVRSDDVERLLSVLVGLFAEDQSANISRAKFKRVLHMYPDVLGNFTIGSGARAAVSGHSSLLNQEQASIVDEQWKWIQENPKRTFTYILTFLVITACFFWRFARYAGDCSGVDLDYRDPFLNVTRREVMDSLEAVGKTQMSNADAKYMAFSLTMYKHDPIGCQGARKRRLLSWTLPLAKGCGQGMKATFTLILLPVSRTLMTKLRRTYLRNIFDFDNAISYHRTLGKIGFALAWSHTILHVVDAIRWSKNDLFKQWSFAFPRKYSKQLKGSVETAFDLASIEENATLIQGIPADLLRDPSEQPTFAEVLGSDFAITGIILITTYSIAALFAFDYPKGLALFKLQKGEVESALTPSRRISIRIGRILNNFNYFWYTHHLFAIFYLAMLFHPMPHIPDERNEWAWSDSWLWIIVPVGFYLMERLDRLLQSSSMTPVIDMRLLPGKVVAVKTRKPDNRKYLAGQYVFVNCFQIAPFEWHPFTLTSAPHDDYLGVHIRAVGDWTNALYNAVKNYKGYANSRTNMALDSTKQYPFNIRIAGPYGAPAQSYREFGVIMCVGAGIGVTPFASIISSVLHDMAKDREQKLKKVYFHWTVRSRNEASWFRTLMEEIAIKDGEGQILDINIHITSMKEGNDLRVMLLRLAEMEDGENDLEQGMGIKRANLHFGRPDWHSVLRSVRDEYPDESRVGVFYCGPPTLKKELKTQCQLLTRRGNGPRFVFRKEIF